MIRLLIICYEYPPFSGGGGIAVQGIARFYLTSVEPFALYMSPINLNPADSPIPIIAGVGSVLAGALAPRYGSRVILRVCGPLVPLGLVLIGYAGSIPVLLVGMVVVGFGLGSVDASMNSQGSRVQDGLGRSVVASYYAAFSLAGLVGARAAIAAFAVLGLVAGGAYLVLTRPVRARLDLEAGHTVPGTV